MPYRGPLVLTVDEADLILDGLPPPGHSVPATKLRERMTVFLRDLQTQGTQPTESPQEKERSLERPQVSAVGVILQDEKVFLVSAGQSDNAFPEAEVADGSPEQAVREVLPGLSRETSLSLLAVCDRPRSEPSDQVHRIQICYFASLDSDAASKLQGGEWARRDSMRLCHDHEQVGVELMARLKDHGDQAGQ